MAGEGLKLKGRVTWIIERRDGTVEVVESDNLVTDAGKDLAVSLLTGLATSPVQYIAIGDGSATNPGQCTQPSATDTALGNELARAQATVTKTANVGEVELSASFTVPAGATWSVCESGLFDAASGGTLYARDVTLTKNLAAGERINVIWRITIQ